MASRMRLSLEGKGEEEQFVSSASHKHAYGDLDHGVPMGQCLKNFGSVFSTPIYMYDFTFGLVSYAQIPPLSSMVWGRDWSVMQG